MTESAVIHEHGLFGQIDTIKSNPTKRSRRLEKASHSRTRQCKPRNRKTDQTMDKRSGVSDIRDGLTHDQQVLVEKAFWIIGHQLAMARKRGVRISDECESDAQFALIQSVRRYKPELGTFESWAIGWVCGAIKRASKRGRRFKGPDGIEVIPLRQQIDFQEVEDREQSIKDLFDAVLLHLAPRHQEVAKGIIKGESQKAIAKAINDKAETGTKITDWNIRQIVGLLKEEMQGIIVGRNRSEALFPDV